MRADCKCKRWRSPTYSILKLSTTRENSIGFHLFLRLGIVCIDLVVHVLLSYPGDLVLLLSLLVTICERSVQLVQFDTGGPRKENSYPLGESEGTPRPRGQRSGRHVCNMGTKRWRERRAEHHTQAMEHLRTQGYIGTEWVGSTRGVTREVETCHPGTTTKV